MIITSRKNSHVLDVCALRQKKTRIATGTFILEGEREIMRALLNNIEIASVYYCPALIKEEHNNTLLPELKKTSAKWYEVHENVMGKLAYRDVSDGIVVIARAKNHFLSDIALDKNSLILIGENIEKPGNIGAMMRTADAVGANAFILCGSTPDLYNPNVIRASTGTLFSIPIAITDVDTLKGWIEKNGIELITAWPSAKISYTDINYTNRCAVLVGSEANGISQSWESYPSTRVSISMRGIADSLNVSVSATLIMFEAIRGK